MCHFTNHSKESLFYIMIFNLSITVGDWKLYDGEKPNIYSCPTNNVVLTIPPGETKTVVGWTEPWARDNSGKQPTKTNNINPMSEFSLGRTRVEYMFTDDQGNSAMCAFDIILISKYHIILCNHDNFL